MIQVELQQRRRRRQPWSLVLTQTGQTLLQEGGELMQNVQCICVWVIVVDAGTAACLCVIECTQLGFFGG